MKVFTLFLFVIFFAVIIAGNVIERRVINRKLAGNLGKKKTLAYTKKRRLENLESYKQFCDEEGVSKRWYFFLKISYDMLPYLSIVIIIFGVITFIT